MKARRYIKDVIMDCIPPGGILTKDLLGLVNPKLDEPISWQRLSGHLQSLWEREEVTRVNVSKYKTLWKWFLKPSQWIIAVEITTKQGAKLVVSFPGSETIGIHTKHLVGENQDPGRGQGISLRRNDTKGEFYWIPTGSYSRIHFLWNED